MRAHTVQEFRLAVARGEPIEAIARMYGLERGSDETIEQLAIRIELLLASRGWEPRA